MVQKLSATCQSIRISKKYKSLVNPSTRYCIVSGGRGSAKSFTLQTIAAGSMLSDGRDVWLNTRYTMTSAGISIIPEFKEKVDLLGANEHFQFSGITVSCSTGAQMIFQGVKTSSGNNTAKLKSLHGVNRWILEEAEEMWDEREFDSIDFSFRSKNASTIIYLVFNPGHIDHWIYQRFFCYTDENGNKQTLPDDFNGVHGDATYVHTTYLDNLLNLDSSFINRAERMKIENPTKYEHIMLGRWRRDQGNALWSQTLIDTARVSKSPLMRRIVVAIDPSVSNSETADECGLIVAGLGADNRFYILEDATAKLATIDWGRRAIDLFKKWNADRIIGEVNNGGDLVENLLRSIDKRIPFSSVRASRGKIARAEPVSALYEQGVVSHVGRFEKLEREMTTYQGAIGEDSPNRMDALVWALTELNGGSMVESSDFSGGGTSFDSDAF